MAKPSLAWLPEGTDFTTRIKALEASDDVAWDDLVSLANLRLDFLRTERLSRLLLRHFADVVPPALPTKPVRLAVLGSSTTSHLLAAIRTGALRRNIWISLFEGDYGQYLQDLEDPNSELHRFQPEVVLFAFDARHLSGNIHLGADEAAAERAVRDVLSRLEHCWSLARAMGAIVIQQTILPSLPTLLGNNEQRLASSAAGLVARLNTAMRSAVDAAGVHLLAIDAIAAQDGISEWHDPALWHRAKQDISPIAAPVYGDLVGRLLAALQGRSYKCLVLDLDNTVWGGVIGDDGLDGISIGQGSATGEAYLAVQAYAKALSERGIILAVCSKNDEANALAPFERHPDMLLRRADISCFVANWEDKASNLRRIASQLNIGLDSLVFLDDNPFERNLVRTELPMIAVPEVPDDVPELMPEMLARGGYFETLSITDEDRVRTHAYRANQERAVLEQDATDLPSYLRSLEMELIWRHFDRISLGRIVQLINKTNQFNLTTRRTNEEQISALMEDPRAFGLQLRLRDRFGDNGIISVVIGRLDAENCCHIDTWLMSCRVLGRSVEQATLGIVVEQAKALGAGKLVGEYVPTAKNSMVSRHYSKLGFVEQGSDALGGSVSTLLLHDFVPQASYMVVTEGT
jgi:FkbH-like protein